MTTLPLYIDDIGHGGICSQVPIVLQGATMYCFPLLVERTALDKFVRSQLTLDGCPVRYDAPLPFVLHSWMDVPCAISTAQPIGWQTDRECAFMVPVRQTIDDGSGQPQTTWQLWSPYLFMNQASGVVTGREVWGYRKSFGEIDVTVPGDGNLPLHLGARTQFFRAFAPTTRCEWGPIVQIHGTPQKRSARARLADPTMGMSRLLRALGSAYGSAIPPGMLGALRQMLKHLLLAPTLPVINLKQFRDAQDSTRACYQALVQGPCEARPKGLPRMLLDWKLQLEVTTCQSHQIATDLGLGGSFNDRGNRVLDLPFGFAVQLDLLTLQGQTLWQAGAVES